jgi:transcriptional regulator with XRE-family HTH domain
MLPNVRWMVQVRRHAGVTLKEIAKRAGISIQYLHDQERGHRPVQERVFKVYTDLDKSA